MEEGKASTQPRFVFMEQEDKRFLKLSIWPTAKHFFNLYIQEVKTKSQRYGNKQRKKREKKMKIMSVGYTT
ncbi:unnamed protein product [Prunus brigantina]